MPAQRDTQAVNLVTLIHIYDKTLLQSTDTVHCCLRFQSYRDVSLS